MQNSGAGHNRFKQLLNRYWDKKKWTLPVSAVVLIVLLGAIPFTRYALAGIVLKQDYSVLVLDNATEKPVTNAMVSLAGKMVKTDNKGLAILHVKVGNGTLAVSKKYYSSSSSGVLVPISATKQPKQIHLTAFGRQVPITVTNTITGKPVVNAVIKAAETEAKTNSKGQATIVLPAAKATLSATISANGYNNVTASVLVTNQADKQNDFHLTPTGKVYFLSKLTGTINVVKTNLDGTDRQTVLAGTGNEDDGGTVLLASRDWKYLALLSQRDTSGLAKLYLINTSTDKLSTIDSGNASFTLVGWVGNRFVYVVNRNDVQLWQPNGQALKTFDASTGKLATIDQTTAEGTSGADYAQTSFSSVYALGSQLVYAEDWGGNNGHLSGKNVNLYSINVDGSSKKTVQSFPVPVNFYYGYSIELTPYEAQSLYVQAEDGSYNPTYYEYEDGKLSQKSLTSEQFYSTYATYLQSPSGSQTFWAEPRDGKNTLFVGDATGSGGKIIAQLSDYNTYGWYTDNYLLVSKDSSELYVMPADGGTALKISDYHKPANTYYGYGGGYGGGF
jgi:hypothetical protein